LPRGALMFTNCCASDIGANRVSQQKFLPYRAI
jgi:hypothetical protein